MHQSSAVPCYDRSFVPKMLTRPFTVRATQRTLLDTELIEFICSETADSSNHAQ